MQSRIRTKNTIHDLIESQKAYMKSHVWTKKERKKKDLTISLKKKFFLIIYFSKTTSIESRLFTKIKFGNWIMFSQKLSMVSLHVFSKSKFET